MPKSKRQRDKKGQRRASASKRAEKQRGGSKPYLDLGKVKQFDFKKEGTKKIDIVEYKVGKGNPNAEKGDLYFELTFFVHKGVGPDGEDHLCAKKTFNKPCPICKHRTKLGSKSGDNEEEINLLKWKERQLFAIVDPKNKKDGVQVMDKSFHLFGKELDAAIRKYKKKHGEDVTDKFASPDEGLSVQCEVEEKMYKKASFTSVKLVKLVEREEQYDPEELKVPCLEKCLVETPYKELKELFLQSGGDDLDDDTEDDDEDLDDDDSDEEDEDDTESEDDEDGDDDEDEDSDDDAESDDDEDEEDDDSDDDDGDEDDDEDLNDDDDGAEVSKGDTVKFTYKGKKRTGIVKKIANGLAHVKVKGRNDPYAVDPDDCKVISDDDEDDDAFDEDEEEKPRKKKKKK